MSHRKLLGLIGSTVLFLGCFCPIISAPIVGSMNYFQNGKGNGAIVLILAVISLVLTLLKKYKLIWITALASAALLLHTFINFQRGMSILAKESQSEGLFAGLAEGMAQTIQLQWGFALLVIGVVILMFCAAKNNTETDEESKSLKKISNLALVGVAIGLGSLVYPSLSIVIDIVLDYSINSIESVRHQAAETPSATTNSVKPPPEFQPDWTIIPNDFKGDSIVELSKRLDKSKGEFETTDAFNAKIKAIAESKENFVFIDDVGSSDIEYDADKEQFKIKIFNSYLDRWIILEMESSEKTNFYKIYWLNPQIEKRRNDNSLSYLLYPERHENKGLAGDFFKFFVKIPRSEAANHKHTMKALYIVKMIENHKSESLPLGRKINNYLSKDDNSHYISVSIDEIWLYSSVDGKVFEKKSLKNIDWQKIW